MFSRKLLAWRKRPWVWAVVGLAGVVLGCTGTKTWQAHDECATIPKGALPEPNGTFVREFGKRQTFKAAFDDFVIYSNEWLDDGKELGPAGTYHIQQIIRRLPTVPFPVMIQVDPDPEKNAARRSLIVNALAMAGVPDPEQRVLIGFPGAEGLYGEEGQYIYNRMLMTSARGGMGYGFGGGMSGYGGGFGGFGGMSGLGGFGGFGGGGFGGFGGGFGFGGYGR